MYIVQVATEVAPVAKVGGLADVMMGLARELTWKGHTVDILIPKYDCINTKELSFEVPKSHFRSFFQGSWHENTIWPARYNGSLSITFLESHHPSRFFERGCIYGCHDDIDRFLYFSRAVLDWLLEQKKVPDIIHIHDWETAIIAALIRQGPYKVHFEKTRTVLTIHNIAYQGQCQVYDLDKIGVSGAWFDSPERMQEDFGNCLNLLKGGIVFADHATTVSETYAKEVRTADGGKGLHLVLERHANKFLGIINGIDYSYWNPEIDKKITSNYSSDPKGFGKKEKNRTLLRKELGLAENPQKPLVVTITRLVEQKGVHLIKHALLSAHRKGMQCIVLGTTPDPAIHAEFTALAARFESDPDVRILLQQEEDLAHKLFAAADMFLVPSLFEPCGLTQLIALKYGSIPIVRKTGGLADTIFDIDTSSHPNGFSFEAPTYEGLDSAIDRALLMWKNDKDRWKTLMVAAMNCDFSWNQSTDKYIGVYQKILQKVD
jgi:starch synthase